MTRFSEIAHDIESQYNPDFDLNPTAPPVNYIEHRLLELCETLDARLAIAPGAAMQISPRSMARPGNTLDAQERQQPEKRQ